jgi:hypothetical protein
MGACLGSGAVNFWPKCNPAGAVNLLMAADQMFRSCIPSFGLGVVLIAFSLGAIQFKHGMSLFDDISTPAATLVAVQPQPQTFCFFTLATACARLSTDGVQHNFKKFHAWSIKFRRKQKLITQFACKTREESFDPN